MKEDREALLDVCHKRSPIYHKFIYNKESFG